MTAPKMEAHCVAQATSLTRREVELLVSTANGLSLNNLAIPEAAKVFLARIAHDESGFAFSEQEEFGKALLNPPDNSAEVPFELADLAMKLQELNDYQAGLLIGFIEGFWSARQFSDELLHG